MKRIPQIKADQRPIHEKAFGLIFAMDDERAQILRNKLGAMSDCKSKRAAMFCGKPEHVA